MIKIIFLALFLIFGISSLSFGKSYLCIAEIWYFTSYDEDKKKWDFNGGYVEHREDERKFILKTEKLKSKKYGGKFKEVFIQSFNEHGNSKNYCKKDEYTDYDQNTFIPGPKGQSDLMMCKIISLTKTVTFYFSLPDLSFRCYKSGDSFFPDDESILGKCSEI